MLILRPYQQSAIERTHDALRAHRSVLLVGPTGMGKTVVAAHIIEAARARGRACLMLAHRKELIRQPFAKLVRAGVDPRQIGIILAGVRLEQGHLYDDDDIPADDSELWTKYARRRPDAPIQIASINTLRNCRSRPGADLVIVDEAHRALAASYVSILAGYPLAKVVGLTATPERGDGLGLKDAFGAMVVVAQYGELVREGFLLEPQVFTVPRLPDVSRVRVKGSDYDQEELARVCDDEALVGDVVDHYVRRGNGSPAFAFGVNVAHSEHIALRFRDAGVPAAHVSGDTEPGARDRMVRDLATGSLKVLANCDVMTEGVDVPAVKTVILCCPTRSLRRFLQQCGRGSRPSASGLPFVILDHAGSVNDFCLPHVDREWSLDGRKKRPRQSTPTVKTCPDCYAMLPAASRACDCGHVFAAAAADTPPENADGELVEVRALTTDEKRAAWDKIVERWHRENRKRAAPLRPGWCFFEFKRRFGANPPVGCSPPPLSSAQESRRRDFDELRTRAAARGYSPAYAHTRIATQWEPLE